MTILITPFSGKKGDKLIVPLVTADQLAKSTEVKLDAHYIFFNLFTIHKPVFYQNS